MMFENTVKMMSKKKAEKELKLRSFSLKIRHVFGVFLFLGAFTACEIPFFAFDRTPDVPQGSILGRVLRDGKAASFAGIVVQGAGKVVTADSNGEFKVSGLGKGKWSLRVLDDSNNDGIVENSMVRTFLIEEKNVLADKPFVQQDLIEPNTLYLGNLELLTTEELSGSVNIDGSIPSDTGSFVKVYAVREVNYYEEDATESLGLSFGAEASTHVDADGNFKFNRLLFENEPPLAGGPLFAVAVQYAGNSAAADEVISISVPTPLSAGNPAVLSLSQNASVGSRTVLHLLNSDLLNDLADDTEHLSYLLLQTPGSGEFPPCSRSAIPILEAVNERYSAVKFIQPYLRNQGEQELPLGVWDVQLCITIQATGRTYQARLSEQVLATRVGGSIAPLWGPYALTPSDRLCHARCVVKEGDSTCEKEEGLPGGEGYRIFRDCDEDGLRGMPQQRQVSANIYQGIRDRCALQCTAVIGASLEVGEGVSPQTCEINDMTVEVFGFVETDAAQNPNGVYDCDDDGDGQPDYTEVAACYGPGLGTDLDGDGICSGQDAFPECAANDPVLCVAGVFDVAVKDADALIPTALDSDFGDGVMTAAIGGTQRVLDAALVEEVDGKRLVMFGEEYNVDPTNWHMTKWESDLENGFISTGDGNNSVNQSIYDVDANSEIPLYRFEEGEPDVNGIKTRVPHIKTMGIAVYKNKYFVAYTRRNAEGQPRAHLMMIDESSTTSLVDVSLTVDRKVPTGIATDELYSVASDVVVAGKSTTTDGVIVDLLISGMVRSGGEDFAAVWRWQAVLQEGTLVRYDSWSRNPALDDEGSFEASLLPVRHANAVDFNSGSNDNRLAYIAGYRVNGSGNKVAIWGDVDYINGSLSVRGIDTGDAFSEHVLMDVKVANAKLAFAGFSEGYLGNDSFEPGVFPAAAFLAIYEISSAGEFSLLGASGPSVNGFFGASRAMNVFFDGSNVILAGETQATSAMGTLLAPQVLTAWRYTYVNSSAEGPNFTRNGFEAATGLLLPQVLSVEKALELYKGSAAVLVPDGNRLFMAGSLSILNQDGQSRSEDPAIWELALSQPSDCGNGVVDLGETCDVSSAEPTCPTNASCEELINTCEVYSIEGEGCTAVCKVVPSEPVSGACAVSGDECSDSTEIGSICSSDECGSARCTDVGECSCCGVNVSLGQDSMANNQILEMLCVEQLSIGNDPNIEGAPQWKVIAGKNGLNITNMTGLMELDFTPLKWVEKTIKISSNPTLYSVVFEDVSAGHIDISENAILSSVSASRITTLSGVQFKRNPLLDTADINELDIRITDSNGSNSISGNGCNTEPSFLEICQSPEICTAVRPVVEGAPLDGICTPL